MKKIIPILTTLLLCSCTSTVREAPLQTEQTAPPSSEYENTSEANIETAVPESAEEARTIIKENIDYAAFDKAIAQYAADNSVVGMGLCVFAEGKVIYEIDLGYADLENGIPCGENTLYRVASVSKLISTMALMTLYDEGKVDPYSDMEELTGLPFNYSGSDGRVLLWHLLTHTAGLNDSYVYEISPSYYYSVSYVLNNSHTYNPPGEQYCYTNFGLGTVGAVAEMLTGEYFHDFADRVIFSRLDMDAAYCADLLEDRSACANIYSCGELSASPKSWYRNSGYYEDFGLGNSYLNAQCELLISPGDLARLGIVIAGDGSVDGVRILSEEAVGLINTSYYHDDEMYFDVGLSTRIYDDLVDGRDILGHSGCALGNVCGLYYDPADHTGIALCTNGCYLGVDPDNGVYDIINDCISCVYDTFFEAPTT
ncbi:MAG: beta-lactamase family protein [Oscillospiraceae bacterium]|nr:beta-lactamase family protein [Oscillospiraceae bacterium]